MSASVRSIMKSAWVITQEGTRHPQVVVGIISSRKSAQQIKEYVEWLYALLNYGPEDHLAQARYHNPYNPYKACFWQTNTGAPVDTLMMCGGNPHLVARRAKNIRLVESDGEQPLLEWTQPDRLVCDPQTLHVKEKIPGMTLQAPVHLPLHVI